MATDAQITEAKTRAQISVSQVVVAHNNNPGLGILTPEDREHLMDVEFARWLHEIVLRDNPAVQGFPWAPVIAVGGALLILAFMVLIQYIRH